MKATANAQAQSECVCNIYENCSRKHSMAWHERIDGCRGKESKGEMKTYIHSDLIGEQTYKMCAISQSKYKNEHEFYCTFLQKLPDRAVLSCKQADEQERERAGELWRGAHTYIFITDKMAQMNWIHTSSNMLAFSFSLSMSLCTKLLVSVSGSSTSVKSIELYFGCSVLTYCNLSSYVKPMPKEKEKFEINCDNFRMYVCACFPWDDGKFFILFLLRAQIVTASE